MLFDRWCAERDGDTTVRTDEWDGVGGGDCDGDLASLSLGLRLGYLDDNFLCFLALVDSNKFGLQNHLLLSCLLTSSLCSVLVSVSGSNLRFLPAGGNNVVMSRIS